MINKVDSQLHVRGLQKSYGARQVVHNVSLDLASGEVVGLLGPNGSRKTTSVAMYVGLVPTEGGQIFLDGQSFTELPSYIPTPHVRFQFPYTSTLRPMLAAC